MGNTTSLYDLKDFTLLLPPGITLSTIGHFAKAVVGADGKVINLCDHVVYTVEKRYSQETGTFCGSFQAEIGTFCVIHHMEPIVDAQQQLVNSFDCPLLLRTNIIHLVPAACLKHAVSVVHQCDSRCGWMEKDQPTQVERELISVNTTVFEHEHNWNNNKYCFNVYCMSNAL
ncbi:hypothetical protein EMCRGX_G011604 [Ephydatia muelleri]